MKSKERPYVLFVAEAIYNEVSKIKKKNSNFSNIDAIENFIGTKTFNEISSGEFHNKWLNKLKKNNYIDIKTKKKFQKKLLIYYLHKKT